VKKMIRAGTPETAVRSKKVPEPLKKTVAIK
jgi:hypothetical protein